MLYLVFTPTHLKLHFQKKEAGKFITLHIFFYIPKELIMKTLIEFLRSI